MLGGGGGRDNSVCLVIKNGGHTVSMGIDNPLSDGTYAPH
jgi:hypothetical protein